MGALVRPSFDLGQGGATDRLDATRKGADVLVTADYVVPVGALLVSSGIGFGAGWLRSSAKVPSGSDDEDLGGLRLEGHVAGRAPLARSFWLDAGLAVGLSPLAQTGDITDDGITFAGEPRWLVRGAIGVRYGGR